MKTPSKSQNKSVLGSQFPIFSRPYHTVSAVVRPMATILIVLSHAIWEYDFKNIVGRISSAAKQVQEVCERGIVGRAWEVRDPQRIR